MSDIVIDNLIKELRSETSKYPEDTQREAARALGKYAQDPRLQERILRELAKRLAEIDTVKYLGLAIDLVIDLPKFGRADCGIAEAMVHAAGSDNGEVRWKACHHLSTLGGKAASALPLLREVERRFPNDDNVKLAIMALGGSNEADLVGEIEKLLQEAKVDPKKRYKSIDKLGLLKAKAAVPFIIDVLSDPEVHVDVLAASADALKQIGDISATGILRRVLPRAQSLGVGDYVVEALRHLEKLQTQSLTQLSADRFRDNGDGTVSDSRTGLMWQQSDDGEERTYVDALSYCSALRLAGYSDWRLPSVQELKSAVVLGGTANVDRSFLKAKPERYWTSTEFAGQPKIAYTVDFADGGETSYFKVYKYFVRAVRG
jgi:hypothetical protein